jgi:hypothetical protein
MTGAEGKIELAEAAFAARDRASAAAAITVRDMDEILSSAIEAFLAISRMLGMPARTYDRDHAPELALAREEDADVSAANGVENNKQGPIRAP